MNLGSSFAKHFLKQYREHRWPRLRGKNYSNPDWTAEMAKILNKTAKKLGLTERRAELKRVDFTWYRKNESIPTVIAEHENGWGGIFDEEVPKLLASNARLKVLVCYPPVEKHYEVADELLRILKRSGRVGELSDEFLLILGADQEVHVNDPEGFSIYWCHQNYVSEVVRTTWFAESQEVWWTSGKLQYRARIVSVRGNTFKLDVTDKEWKGNHVQTTSLEKVDAR